MFCFLNKPIGGVLVKITNLNATKLKSLLKEQGLSMKFFNDMLGKNRSYLSNVLTGSDSISSEDLEKVAEKLNTTVEYLTDQSDQKEKPTSKEIDVDDILKMMLNLPREKKEELLVKFMQMMKEGE
jgi:transcriptional regulator with XRE-family HTH domain